MAYYLEIQLQDDMDFVSLKHTADGFEAILRTKPGTLDRHGVEIPVQFGFGFKAKQAQDAIRLAETDARAKFAQIKRARNSRPLVPLSEEEELNKLLGL